MNFVACLKLLPIQISQKFEKFWIVQILSDSRSTVESDEGEDDTEDQIIVEVEDVGLGARVHGQAGDGGQAVAGHIEDPEDDQNDHDDHSSPGRNKIPLLPLLLVCFGDSNSSVVIFMSSLYKQGSRNLFFKTQTNLRNDQR